MSSFKEKCHKLTTLIENYTKNDIVIAFSGGVDSALLLKIACEYAKKQNSRVYAVTISTILHTVKEIDFTEKTALEMGAIHKIIKTDELKEAGIVNNPKNRCYLCKKHMFLKVCDFAKSVGAANIIDGTNSDDLKVYRPGIKALSELGIISPLAETDFSKEEVRRLAAEYAVSSSNKPSTPCLATRFEYGTVLDYKKIRAVEEAEEYLRSLGFYNVRVRVHGDIARIEVDLSDIQKLVGFKDDITKYIRALGFKYVTADLEGFVSGSMDR